MALLVGRRSPQTRRRSTTFATGDRSRHGTRLLGNGELWPRLRRRRRIRPDGSGRGGVRRRAAPARGRCRRRGPRRPAPGAGRRASSPVGGRRRGPPWRAGRAPCRPGQGRERRAGRRRAARSRCFSAALSASQLRSTSSAPATSRPANTCGCRWTSLSTMPPATSSIVNPSSASSAAIRAWKYTCSSRSPSSSRRWASRRTRSPRGSRRSPRAGTSPATGGSAPGPTGTRCAAGPSPSTRSSSRAPGHVVRRVQDLDLGVREPATSSAASCAAAASASASERQPHDVAGRGRSGRADGLSTSRPAASTARDQRVRRRRSDAVGGVDRRQAAQVSSPGRPAGW